MIRYGIECGIKKNFYVPFCFKEQIREIFYDPRFLISF